MTREFDGYRLNKTRDFFNNNQKRIIDAWIHGIEKPTEIADHLGLAIGTIKHYDFEIIDKLKDNEPGSDRRAKAVTLASQKGWIDPAIFPDNIKRKLTEGETKALTFRILGYTRSEVSDKLKISEDEVNNNLDAICHLIGVKNDYGAIAWAILKVIKKPQPVETK